MRTTHLLCEHAEKIAAAIALRKTHNQLGFSEKEGKEGGNEGGREREREGESKRYCTMYNVFVL